LKGLPNVTVFGARTLGALSSILMKSLPNGARIGIANEVWQDRHGRSFEAVGIPPDVEATPFDPKKLVTGYLEFVRSAVNLASSKVGEPAAQRD